jgi:hypothetical protein
MYFPDIEEGGVIITKIQFYLFLNFIFELFYINKMRGFIVIITYVCIIYFEQVHPLHYIFNPPFSKAVFGGFHYAIFICRYVEYFHSSLPSDTVLFQFIFSF